MKLVQIKFYCETTDLKRTEAFYSAIGMDWIGGNVGPQSLASSFGELPELAGRFANIDFYFKLNKSFAGESSGMLLLANFDDSESIIEIVEKLKVLGLYRVAPDFDDSTGGIIFDPDGRAINLCGPNPWRL